MIEELFRIIKKKKDGLRKRQKWKDSRSVHLSCREKGMERDYEKLRGAFIEVNGKYKIKN